MPPLSGEQVLFRPWYATAVGDFDAGANPLQGGDPSLWSGLLTLDASFTPVPDWALSWESSPDGSMWTFFLRRDNAGWSTGEPVTAQDFVWSWQRLVDPKTAAPHAWLLQDIVNFDAIRRGELLPDRLGVRALDRWTLEVQLVGPRANFPAIVTSPGTVPVHRPSIEAFGERWTDVTQVVSNGPFRLTTWEPGVRFETARNGGHWNVASIHLTRTVARILAPERKSQPYFNSLVDFLPVQPDDLEAVRRITSLGGTLEAAIEPAIWFVTPNPTLTPFDDVRVRRAVALTIDPERLLQISGGKAIPAQSLLPRGWPFHVDDTDVAALQRFDVDQALRLLAGTNFAGGRNWPPISLSFTTGDLAGQELVYDLAAQLAENLGMVVEVRPLGAEAFVRAANERSGHLFWHRWEFSYADPHNGYGDAFFPVGGGRPRLPVFPEGYRALVERARGEQNRATRAMLYRECERLLQSDVFYIPIAYPTTYFLVRPWVTNWPTTANRLLIAPGRVFTRLTSFLGIRGRPSG